MHVIKGYGVWFIFAPPKKWSNYGLAMHFVIKLGWGFPANGFAAFSSSPVLLFMTEMWKSRPLKLLYLLVEWRCSVHASSQYSQPKCKQLGLQHSLWRDANPSIRLQHKKARCYACTVYRLIAFRHMQRENKHSCYRLPLLQVEKKKYLRFCSYYPWVKFYKII